MLTLLSLGFALLAFTSHAGILDAVKKKATDQATKEAEKAVGKTGSTGKAADPKPAGAAGDSATTAPGAKAGGGPFSSISTKFDYVPGDSVILMDDFTLDELGEFPVRWRLKQGTYEIVDAEGKRWLRCTSNDGRVRMKATGAGPLPEFWTLEFDLYPGGVAGPAVNIRALNAKDSPCWEAVFPQGTDLAFRSGEFFSSTPLEDPETAGGPHHVMVMVRGPSVKVYVDRQRMASVPEVSMTDGMPTDIELRMFTSTQPMIANVRYAKGCRPPKDLLAEGKLVTYGIYFESGSDVVLPESAPVLRQIASYLEANAAVKLKITGHTDNVGSATSNLDLSKRRAASVAKALSEQFGIAADRFETDGQGDSQAVASNAKPEGRAMNRRVEFAKL
jgi:outer membrane protein OmpA-like peptidoglycan-associated protein